MSETTAKPPDPLTLKELCDRWRTSRDTVSAILNAGMVEGAYRLFREWRIPLSGVEAYEAKGGALEAFPAERDAE